MNANAIVGETASAQEIDRELRAIARRRAGLDAELLRWLRRADAQPIWNSLGYVHGLEYLEDVFAFSPRAGRERLRVARELADLPALESALERGELTYGIVRELTRVATAETEAKWLAIARGKNLRQVERLVAGHAKGDLPDDEANPDLLEWTISFKLNAAVAALLRESRKHLCDEIDDQLDDVQFIEALCRRALEPANGNDSPARMIHISTCRACTSATQVGAGRRVPITPSELALAACDAVIVDDESGKRPTSAIPAATRRLVMERDEHRCRVPGCRSARNLDVHHIIPISEGGGHEAWNLIVLCSGHHRCHHEGRLAIRGRADGELSFSRNGRMLTEDKQGHVFARHAVEARMKKRPMVDDTARDVLAERALVQSGFTRSVARAAVRSAAPHIGDDADLATLLREALRFCR
jgi:hypothetical protein